MADIVTARSTVYRYTHMPNIITAWYAVYKHMINIVTAWYKCTKT